MTHLLRTAALLILLAAAARGERLAAPMLANGMQSALKLAQAGELTKSLAILDQLVASYPEVTKLRFLRAKVRIKAKDWEGAEADLAQVVKEAPTAAVPRDLLAKVRARLPHRSVTVVGGPSTYSEWQWSWKIPGDKPFALADFKGGQGSTLFYWRARPGDDSETAGMERDSADQRYFLRVVEGTGPDADHKVPARPYMILLDATGAEIARGAPDAVQPKLAALQKPPDPPAGDVSRADFSTDTSIEALGQLGTDTLVMVTSDG